LKSLRAAKGLSQPKAGLLMGLIKNASPGSKAPGRAGLAQVAKLVALLGGRLVIDDGRTDPKKSNATW
jgi:hypothetical protein